MRTTAEKVLTLLLLGTLGACSQSDEDKLRIAEVACAIMNESLVAESSMRIREVNLAREKIKTEPYLGTDLDIRDAIRFGLCEDLVLNAPGYLENLARQRELEAQTIAEQERLEAERVAEARRLAAEQLAEERRIAAQRLAEQQRLDAERLAREREESERLFAEAREREAAAEAARAEERRAQFESAQAAWRAAIVDSLQNFTASLVRIEGYGNVVTIITSCNEAFLFEIEAEFVDGSVQVENALCDGTEGFATFRLSDDQAQRFAEFNNSQRMFNQLSLRFFGVSSPLPERRIDPATYPPLRTGAKLASPVVFQVLQAQ